MYNHLLNGINNGLYFNVNRDVARVWARTFSEFYRDTYDNERTNSNDMNDPEVIIKCMKQALVRTDNYIKRNYAMGRFKKLSTVTRPMNRSINEIEQRIRKYKINRDRLARNTNELTRNYYGSRYMDKYKIKAAANATSNNSINNLTENINDAPTNSTDQDKFVQSFNNNYKYKFKVFWFDKIARQFRRIFHFFSGRSKLNQAKSEGYYPPNNDDIFSKQQLQPQVQPSINQNSQTQTDTFNDLNDANNQFSAVSTGLTPRSINDNGGMPILLNA